MRSRMLKKERTELPSNSVVGMGLPLTHDGIRTTEGLTNLLVPLPILDLGGDLSLGTGASAKFGSRTDPAFLAVVPYNAMCHT